MKNSKQFLKFKKNIVRPEGYGDQSPIRPINPKALTYEASDRIIELSKPKPDPMHECHVSLIYQLVN